MATNDPYQSPPITADEDPVQVPAETLDVESLESIRSLRKLMPPVATMIAVGVVLPVMYRDRGDVYVPFASSFPFALAIILCSVPVFYGLYFTKRSHDSRSIVWTLFVLIATVPAAYIVFVPTCTLSFAAVVTIIQQERHLAAGAIPYGLAFWLVFKAISETIYLFLFAPRSKRK